MKKGQSLVELAISFVVLLLLLGGAVEFGMAFFQFVQLRDAAQEGALYGSYCQDFTQIESRTRGASDSPVDLSSSDVSVLIESDGIEGGDLKVTLIYNHAVFMPFISIFVGNTIPLRAEVTDTILKVDCSP